MNGGDPLVGAAHDSRATLQFLLSPATHAADARPIQLIETHLSWVVLDARPTA